MSNLFMVDLEETEISTSEREILKHPNVGAIILFSRNFKSSEQLMQLVGEIKVIRPDIFIAVDHEGGYVQRFLRSGFRVLPSARSFGDLYNLNPQVALEYTRHYGEIMANDLILRGIDLSIAPVIDLHGESQIVGQLDRAFHRDPQVVEVLAQAFIDGMHKAGMPSVCKHFPGHGSCHADSHTVKPVCEKSVQELRQTDLKPFIGLIEKQKVDAIMPAYVTYNAIDTENPAGFSEIWLKKILRAELGFQGLILSDCLSMKGADIGDLITRAKQALRAGCDMLILCNQPRERLHAVLETIHLPADSESANRLKAFKQKMTRQKSQTRILSSTFNGREQTFAMDSADEFNTTKTI